jgi:preprotein translocase subunit SecE
MAKAAKKKVEGNAKKESKDQQGQKPRDKTAQKSLKPKKTDPSKKRTPKKTEGASTGWWQRARLYLREVVYELRKVVWPSYKETATSTLVVLVVVILVGAFLGFADFFLSRIMRWVIG